MPDKHDFEILKADWNKLVEKLNTQFDSELDLQGIIFLIGVQELGRGAQKFSKDEKQDLMHIATCRLLSLYGFYELRGLDQQGWPVWELAKKMPPLTLKEQDILLKNCVIQYFRDEGIYSI